MIPAERGDIGWKEAQTQGDKHNFGNKQTIRALLKETQLWW
jgi:hypothetical protein